MYWMLNLTSIKFHFNAIPIIFLRWLLIYIFYNNKGKTVKCHLFSIQSGVQRNHWRCSIMLKKQKQFIDSIIRKLARVLHEIWICLRRTWRPRNRMRRIPRWRNAKRSGRYCDSRSSPWEHPPEPQVFTLRHGRINQSIQSASRFHNRIQNQEWQTKCSPTTMRFCPNFQGGAEKMKACVHIYI